MRVSISCQRRAPAPQMTVLVIPVPVIPFDAFTAVVQEFDAMSRLDAWKTNLLLKAKKLLEADEDDLT